MCGILGIVGNYDEKTVLKALRLLSHRGPDNLGYYKDGNSFLGHTRLSILDLSSKGNQPMSDREGSIWIVFNGEIYNFKEIRSDLERHYQFRSNTDTEVLIYAYKHYGLDFFKKINGMFAFAIWDREKNIFLLARDRFGKKPLYYTFQNGNFIFSSEIKAILPLLDRRPQINKTAYLQYLSFLSSLPPNTMFEGINKLQAGHYLIFDGTGIKIEEYYDILDNVQPYKIKNLNEALEEIESILIDSVRHRLVADVEVGSFLSGGIDSSLVSAVYSLQKRSQIHTFSIGYNDYKQYDERIYANRVVSHINSIHHDKSASKEDFIDVVDDVVYHLDEPVNDPACIPTYLLSRLVMENNIKVILTGEGSDEDFLGYDFYFEMLKYHNLQNQLNEKEFLLAYFLDNFNLSKRWEYFKRSLGDLPIYRTIGENFTDRQKKLLLAGDAFKNLHDDMSYEFLEAHWRNFKESGLKEPSYWLSYIDFKIWMPEVLMMKVDKMTMAHSIESRSPFLDHRLVELIFSIDCKLREGGQTKALLKPIAERFIPAEIVCRQKKGFSSPYLEWYYEHYGDEILKEWFDMNKELGWFNDEFLEFLYNEGSRGMFKQHVWSLIVFSKWFRIYK
jgi:asparagine synthase (glutamine-hydrolysing)